MSERMASRPELLPGDTLIYSGYTLADLAIRFHTFSRACHVELYIGGGDKSIAARASGVATFGVRWDGLWRVYRPRGSVDMDAMKAYFHNTLKGQKYDWLGVIFGFFFCQLRQNPKRKFCSETQTLLYRAGRFEPFQPDYVPDRVPPMLYTCSAMFDLIYESQN